MFQYRRPQVLLDRKRQIFIALLCISLVFCGCIPPWKRSPTGSCKGMLERTTRIYDRIPDDVPKGYVEFYTEEGNELTGSGIEIYQLHEGKEEHLNSRWYKEFFGSKYYNNRYAAEPGLHIFGVKYGTAHKRIPVKIVSGMITTVGISLLCTREARRTYYFNMYLDVQDPVPLGSASPRTSDRIHPISLPQIFEAHYRSMLSPKASYITLTDKSWWSDLGKLTVDTEAIRFRGRKSQFDIRFEEIEKVSFGEVGFMSVWSTINISYNREGQSLYALFTVGGRVPGLVWAIRYAMERKGMHLIVEGSW